MDKKRYVTDRLGLMHALAARSTTAPTVQQVVQAYKNSEATDADLVRAIADDLARRLCYKPHHLDIGTFPEAVLASGSGDAEDLATVAAACFKALGFPVRFRATRSAGRPFFHGVHVEVGVPASDPVEWVTVNLSVPRGSIFDTVDCDESLDV
jgi:transglutaminase-like putative cysteine protease